MSGESPSHILNQGGVGAQACNTNTTTTTNSTMIPNSVVGSPGVEAAIAAQLNPNTPQGLPSNQGQVPQNMGMGLHNYQQGLGQVQGQHQIIGQQKQGMLRQQQQQMMMFAAGSTSSALPASPSSNLQAQQNMGSMGSNPILSPTSGHSRMHRSASVPGLNASQQFNSSRSPTFFGHLQLPFNHPLQQQQQQQQQQLGGLARSAMMGQGQGTAHLSMLPGPVQSQLMATRQKQAQMQSSQFQQSVSSGQPLQGMQTIRMIDSHGLASQNRMNGPLAYAQQRIAQGTLRSPPASQQQSLSSPQKIQTQNMARVSSLGSINSQLIGLSQGAQSAIVPSSLPHNQQWSKMQQSNLSPSASHSYQLQQQHRQQQAQLQQQAPPSPSQQQPTTSHPQPPSQQQNSSQLQQQQLQQSLQPQSISRTASLTVQKPSTSTGSQPGTPVTSVALPAGSNNQGTEGNAPILRKRTIQDLVAQVDPNEELDPELIDFLYELADDLFQSGTAYACTYAKHRKSATLEEKDIRLHVEKNWHLSIPGYSSKECNKNKRPCVSEAHMQRVALIQKSMSTSQMEAEAGINKGATGPVTVSSNAIAGNSNSGVQIARTMQNSSTVPFSMGSPGVQKIPRF